MTKRIIPGPGHCETPEKKRFYVIRQARQAAEYAEHNYGYPIRVYQCGMHFHLTKKPVSPGVDIPSRICHT